MNILLWILQILLALHTFMGAIWKFSNSAQTVPSLEVIPHSIWVTMSILELVCAVALVLPAVFKKLGFIVPIAATFITLEMLLFCGLFIFSDGNDFGHLIYWLLVAVICTFIAYGRFVLNPLNN